MKVPSHIAIIMDGNGRWAKEKGFPRREGHFAGVKALKTCIQKAGELGIPCLTVYAFSTENWKRPKPEVEVLMHLFRDTLLKQSNDLMQNKVEVKVIGRRKGLSKKLLKAIDDIENLSSNNQGLTLNIAFNYGGRAEICDILAKIISENKEFDINKNIELDLSQFLYNPTYSDVELLIRTGGEKRLSNFMLWQSAYAELYFLDKYWPDFKGSDLEKAIQIFQERKRRFGGLEEMGD